MNYNKKRLYLLVSAILAGGIAYAAPATTTVTNLQELIDAGGVIETSDYATLRIKYTKLFEYDGVVNITHTLDKYSDFGIESLTSYESDMYLKQLNYTMNHNNTKTDKPIVGISIQIGNVNENAFNGSRLTIGDNSTINITGNSERWVTGLEVLGSAERYNDGIDSIIEANIGDNSTFNIDNIGSGKTQGIEAYYALATVNLGENVAIHTKSNGRSSALSSNEGGTIVAKKGLNVLAESNHGDAYAIQAWGTDPAKETHHAQVILNGASLTAKAKDPDRSFAINAWAGGQVIGNQGVYHIDGLILSETDNGLSSSIDMNFDSGSTFQGATLYTPESEINFDMKGTTWNITDYSNITNLIFSDESSVINFVADDYAILEIENLAGNGGLFNLRTSIAEDDGDYLYIINGSGSHKLAVKDSGVEITQPDEIEHALVTDESGNTHFTLAKVDGTNINVVDGGTYLYYLHDRDENGEKIWYLSAEKQIDPDPTDPTPPILETTPSTDAVISLASAPQLIMANEMNNLRFRKGSVKANAESAGVWGACYWGFH